MNAQTSWLHGENGTARRFGVRTSEHRCFGVEVQGFSEILPINIIIGRNNAGKSTLLDIIEAAVHWNDSRVQRDVRSVRFCTKLARPELEAAFPSSSRGGNIPGASHWDYGKQFVGHDFEWICDRSESSSQPRSRFSALSKLGPIPTDAWEKVAQRLSNPLQSARFYKLAAARDVVPQQAFDPRRDGGWKSDGSAVTSLVSAFVNLAELPTEAVSEELLGELNRIVSPVQFRGIVPQMNSDGLWELYLEEASKGRIPLSASGAGYKTLLSTLALIDLMPKLERRKLNSSIFALEELENNLHPALQRRLLEFVRERASRAGATFFLTTHSSIVIDMFQGDESAQIIHVEHDGRYARTSCVVSKGGYRAVLDDLDVRASDLLQSNGIVWVEGPSDRKYFNRWIELWTNGRLREGVHYRCLFYGGKLLAHLTADDARATDEFVSLLDVNRNAIVLMDRDRPSPDEPVNSTKTRVCLEVEKAGGIAWVTQGREIENYIPMDLLQRVAGLKQTAQHDAWKPFKEVLTDADESAQKVFQQSKVAFADFICPHISKGSLDHLDLQQRLARVVETIDRWNATSTNVISTKSAAQLGRCS